MSLYKAVVFAIRAEPEFTLDQLECHLERKIGYGQKYGKLTFKDIVEPMRTIGTHKDTLKTCLSLTSFNLTVMGDLQEKWIFTIMLHAHLAQYGRSGWRSRSCKLTIR